MGKTVQVFGFPFLVDAEVVKDLLEKYTGKGSIYALEVKQSKGGRRAYARVQFTNSKSSDIIIALANGRRLYYGASYLKAWEMDIDMVPRPRVFTHVMEGLVLNFGCQVSNNKFSVLWKAVNVTVKFSIGMNRMYFYLTFANVKYKLELLRQSIWQIVLHRPYLQTSKFLLIQVSFLKFVVFIISYFYHIELLSLNNNMRPLGLAYQCST